MFFYPTPFICPKILMVSVIGCVKNMTVFEVVAWKISTLMETKDVLTSFINRYRKIKIHKTKNEK